MEKIGKCIWCGEEKALSKTHIFPRILGEKYAEDLACIDCNNYLGTTVESRAYECAVLASASKKMGLVDSQGAYRHADKFIEGSSYRIIFRGEKACVEPCEINNGHFRANLSDLLKYHNAKMRKLTLKYPNESIKELKRTEKRIIHQIGPECLVLQTYEPGETKILMHGLTLEPPIELTYKIIYETIALGGIIWEPIFQKFKSKYIAIDIDDKKNRIKFDDSIRKVSFTNATEFDDIANKEDYEYE